jgi:hypothetical protein
MDPFVAFISFVNLLADFTNERRAQTAHTYEEFRAWLEENRHDDVITLLQQSAATATSIKALLTLDRQALHERFDRIDRSLAIIAGGVDGFAQLAGAVRPLAKLSQDALNFLRDIERSGSGRVLETRLVATQLPELVPLDTYTRSNVEIKYRGDARFYEDDIGILLETGLLRLRHDDKGRRIFIMTREASDFVRAGDAKATK